MENDQNLHDFGPFRLDTNERVLLRAGRRVPLPAKAVSTLIVLVKNKGRIVEKDDLMKEVWPNEFVEEGNLAQHIFMLRRAFGETAEQPKYIETVPRRGYRFLEPAKEVAASVPVEVPPRSQSIHSLAVLPFLNGTVDPRTKYFADKAYEVYLQGRLHWCKHTSKGLEQATEYFLTAIEFDPCYAMAYAAIVDCYLRLATNYLPPPDALPATAVPEEATTIQELPPETVAALRLRQKWDVKSSEREFDRAISLNLNYPAMHQWQAAHLFARSLYCAARDNLQPGREDTATQELTLRSEVRLAERSQSISLTPAEEAQILCVVAREQIQAGNMEAACLVLQNWYRIGKWPNLEGLNPHSSVDMLFTVGRLAGRVGSTRQLPRIQKHAEALLNGAIGISEQLGLKRQSAEGRLELSVCYWREGLFDLARDTLLAVLDDLNDEDSGLRVVALLRLAMTEQSAGRLHDAITRLKEAAPMMESAAPWITADYNNQLAITFKCLETAENRTEYFERAAEHYREVLYQCEAVGHHQYAAVTENNYANLFLFINRLEMAESHMIRARKLGEHQNDRLSQAYLDDTSAQFYIAAEQFDLAEKAIARSIGTLEGGGEDPSLVESLITQGLLLCRIGRHRQAKRVLERALQIAERCGDRRGAKRALVTLIQEMRDQLEDDERIELRETLDQLLLQSA